MTKTKYAILTTVAILSLIALAPFLQLQAVNAQADNSDNGDNPDSSGSNFGERHPTFCTIAPSIASVSGHPLIGILIDGICTLS